MSDCPKDYGQRHAKECDNIIVTERIIEGAWGDGYVAATRDAKAERDAAFRAGVEAAAKVLEDDAPPIWRDCGYTKDPGYERGWIDATGNLAKTIRTLTPGGAS